MVDLLANEFSDQPVVFLEYDVDHPAGDRISRWWTANTGSPSVTLPLVMVDSGQGMSNGYVDFANVYRSMVETELARPPLATIEFDHERVGNSYQVNIELTNLSEQTLGSSNDATLHVIVYEQTHVADTDRWVREAATVPITDLATGASAEFSVNIPLQGVNWSRLHVVVLADYRPDGNSGPYDILQAAHR